MNLCIFSGFHFSGRIGLLVKAKHVMQFTFFLKAGDLICINYPISCNIPDQSNRVSSHSIHRALDF